MSEPEAFLHPEITPEAFRKLRNLAPAESSPGEPAPAVQTPLLLDVREPWEIALASLPGSTLIPMADIPSRAHAELDPDQPIVVLCHHGARSLSVTMWLRAQGFDHVQSLSGGIDQWSRTIDPSIPRY